jgi:hypothetical protein
MLPRNLTDGRAADSLIWDDLVKGVPTIMALANLCSRVQAEVRNATVGPGDLPAESRAILCAADKTGAISIRGDKNAFEPGERYLAVCVELPEGARIEFRCADNPEQTIRFVEGFRRLCQTGLAMHHLMNEFSLTAAGFEMARQIDRESVAELLALGRS